MAAAIAAGPVPKRIFAVVWPPSESWNCPARLGSPTRVTTCCSLTAVLLASTAIASVVTLPRLSVKLPAPGAMVSACCSFAAAVGPCTWVITPQSVWPGAAAGWS